MTHLSLLHSLGWPEDVTVGSISWSRTENDRNGMTASLHLSHTGEIVMFSQASFNGRSHSRFNAHVAAGQDFAQVAMPGYNSDKMPVAQAVALFRAHVSSMDVAPQFRSPQLSTPRI